jgi:hypothetical protein
LQPVQKLSAEKNQRIEALEGNVEQIESQLAQYVAGLGQAFAKRTESAHLAAEVRVGTPSLA